MEKKPAARFSYAPMVPSLDEISHLQGPKRHPGGLAGKFAAEVVKSD